MKTNALSNVVFYGFKLSFYIALLAGFVGIMMLPMSVGLKFVMLAIYTLIVSMVIINAPK